jgi:uncharacterized protein YigA (DUF484 family)
MITPLHHPITEDDIANYLGSTPDFFERHAELLSAVHLSSPHSKRAVSLQERQAEMLREKIKALEHRIMDMIRHGNENLMLSDRLLRWSRGLIQGVPVAALPDRIVSDIQSQFSVPQVGLRLWDLATEHAQAPCAQGVSEDARQFAQSLNEPFCGVNSGFEVANWLPDPAAAASLALLPLRVNAAEGPGPVFGLLVLASPDSQRFNSAMGTDFLERIAELTSAALARLRP